MQEIEEVETIRKLWLQGYFDNAIAQLNHSSISQPYLTFEKQFIYLFQGDLNQFDSLCKNIEGTTMTFSEQLVYHTLILHKSMFQGIYNDKYTQLMEDIEVLIGKIGSANTYTKFWYGIYWLLCGNFLFYTNSGVQLAIEYWEKTLPVVEDYTWYSGNYLYIAVHNNIAEILRLTGSVEESLAYLELAKQRMHQAEMDFVLPEIYSQLGSTYYELNQYEKAIIHYQEGLRIKYLNNIPTYHALYLYRLFKLYQKVNDQKGITTIQQSLAQLEKQHDVAVVNEIHQIIKAELLITENRRKTITQAQEILIKLNNNNSLPIEFIPLVKFHTLNLLINELAHYSNNEILTEINKLMEELINLTKEWKSVRLEIELMIIRSKLELAQQNVEIAFSQLNLALNRAQTIENKRVESEIIEELDQLDKQVKTWSRLISNNPSIQKMLSELELDEYVRDVVNRLGS